MSSVSLSSELSNLGMVLETPKFITGIGSDGGLVWTLSSNSVIGPYLLVTGVRSLEQTWQNGRLYL